MRKHEVMNWISNSRHEVIRFRAGMECGELFEKGVEYDGLTLTIGIASIDEAKHFLQAIHEHT